jgi:hypothetical protein
MTIKSAICAKDEGSMRSTSVHVPDFDLDRVQVAIKGIRYGEVRVIIQDHVIVQIERLEKQRLR